MMQEKLTKYLKLIRKLLEDGEIEKTKVSLDNIINGMTVGNVVSEKAE